VSLYTPAIQRIFKSMRAMCPYPKFVVDLVEHADYIELRVYKENIEEYSDNQKVALADYLYKLREAIALTGTKCFIQGSENPVPYKNWEGKQ
jgi:hypothetical protein